MNKKKWVKKNGAVSGGHCYIISHTVSESKNHNPYILEKRDENTHNIYEMENTGMKDGVEIDVMLHASTIHQYFNLE